jgi:hypothetical protein
VPHTNPYGRRLSGVAQLAIDGACDIALDDEGHIACVAARNAVVILDLHEPADPRIIGRLDVCGSGRQIERQGNIACMTARADGLFIFDVGDPLQPRLLCHYDTVELATGVCMSGDFCFVACRHMGVELIDISNPKQPKHAASILAGEAQSVFVSGQYLYVGAWVEREVMIFDISDPTRPVKCGACALDGYGDGLFVWQNTCFAAAGHHARTFHNRVKYQTYDFVVPDMLEDGYGCGHGLELFDVADPDRPALLSRLKAPPQFLSGNDLWDVSVSEGYAYWADSYAGLFIVNVSDPHAPTFAGYYRFPVSPDEPYHVQPSIQQPCGPLNGLAVGRGHVYLASVNFGIHIIEFAAARPIAPVKPFTPLAVADKKPGRHHPESVTQLLDAQVVFKTHAQVHAVGFLDRHAFVAAGTESLFVLDADSCVVQYTAAARGSCMDLKYYQDRILVAEGSAGFSVWKLSPSGLVCTARIATPQAARQVVVYDELAIAAVQLGANSVQFWDLTEIDAPHPLACFQERGNLYYKNIMNGLYQHRYAVVMPLKPAASFYDLANRDPIIRTSGDASTLCPLEDGMTVYREKLITVTAGKIYCEDQAEPLCPDGPEVKGWPVAIEDKLFLVNRHSGVILVYHIQDIANPVYLGQIDTGGHPETIMYHNDALWIPCGHWGLLRIDLTRQSFGNERRLISECP